MMDQNTQKLMNRCKMDDADSSLHQWKLDAAEYHQDFYTRLGDREWDQIPLTDRKMILDKISGSYFSSPYDTCSGEQQRLVQNVSSKVRELSGSNKFISLGFVYVCILTKSERQANICTVIRTKPRYENKIYFVESHTMRVYTGWTDYKKNNALPECWVCYPINGFYMHSGDRVVLEYGESPACSKHFNILDVVMGVSSVVLGVSTVVCPPLLSIEGPILMGLIASGGYTVGRTVSQLCDRGSHHQSVNPLNKQALPIWLRMIASISSTALGGAAVARSAVGRFGAKLTAAIFRYACIGVNSFGAVLCVIDLVLKFRNGTLTYDDINHFLFLAFFIGNIIISHAMARQVVEAVADEPRLFKNMFNMLKNTAHQTSKTLMTGDAFQFVIELLTGPVTITILRQIEMPRIAQTLQALKSSAMRLTRGSMSYLEFTSHAVTVLYPYLTDFRTEISIAIKKLQKFFNMAYNYVLINFKMLFQYSSPVRMVQIKELIEQPVDNLDIHISEIRDSTTEVMLKFAMKMAEEVACETDCDFSNLCAFLATKVTRAYDSQSIVTASNGKRVILERDKARTFKDVIAKMDRRPVKYELKDEYKKMQSMAVKIQPIFDQPVYQSSEATMHYFITNSDVRNFDQFIYDAACELLGTERLFEEAVFTLRDSLFVILFHQKVLFFFFEIDNEKHEVDGMAVLSRENV